MSVVKLKNKKEFEKILSEYELSDESLKVLQGSNYTILIGPTAAGRNTVMAELVKSHNFVQLVSDTTRPPKVRDGELEKDGVVYNFISEKEFLNGLKRGKYLEAELIHNQQVSGTSIRELIRLGSTGKPIVNEMEYGGAQLLLEKHPGLSVIALLPPSYSIWKKRFEGREEITALEYKNRAETFLEVLDTIESK